jgi:hypothetical protein
MFGVAHATLPKQIETLIAVVQWLRQQQQQQQ